MARLDAAVAARVATGRWSGCSISTSIGSRSSTIRSATRSATWCSRRRPVGSWASFAVRRARPARWRRVHDVARRPAWSRGGDFDRGARRRRARRALRGPRGGGSTSRRASASRRISMRPTTARSCSRTRTPPNNRAKQGGRNRIEVFDIELRESIQRRLGDEQELRDALSRGDILAWYQPEVELSTGRVVGAEALARWLHAERGMLDASKFRPARRRGRPRVPARRSDRHGRGRSPGRARARRCRSAFSDLVQRVIRSADPGASQRTTRGAAVVVGCDPSQIGIEITETAILPDVKAAAREIAGGTGDRDQGCARRLRNGSLVADTAALAADRPGQDRPDISCASSLAMRTTRAIVRSVINPPSDLGLEVVARGESRRRPPEQTVRRARLPGAGPCVAPSGSPARPGSGRVALRPSPVAISNPSGRPRARSLARVITLRRSPRRSHRE